MYISTVSPTTHARTHARTHAHAHTPPPSLSPSRSSFTSPPRERNRIGGSSPVLHLGGQRESERESAREERARARERERYLCDVGSIYKLSRQLPDRMNYSLRIIPCERHQCCFFVVRTASTSCPEQSTQIVIGDHVSTAYSQLLEARVNRFDI